MFDWGSNLQVAEELIKNEQEEYHRSAISRAYYAAFGTARTYLDSKSFPYDNGKGSIHKKVWASFELIASDIFVIGDRLKRSRVNADYDSNMNNYKSKSKRAIQDSRLIQKKVSEL